MRFLFATTCLFLSFCIIVNTLSALGKYMRLPQEREVVEQDPPPEGVIHIKIGHPQNRWVQNKYGRWIGRGPYSRNTGYNR